MKGKKLNQAIIETTIAPVVNNPTSELFNTNSTAESVAITQRDREHIDTIEQQKKVLEDHRLKIHTLEV